MSYSYQTQIKIAAFGFLNVSHIHFKEGSLVGSESEKKITKPAAYHSWRTKRKETFLAGRIAVCDAQNLLKVPITTIHKAKNGSPIWPEGYIGSIAHTNNHAIAVLLPCTQAKVDGIGIDIESITSAALLEAPHMIGIESEFQILIEIGVKTTLTTLLLFSLKESIYKALFPLVEKFFDFLDAELIAIDEDVFTFKINCHLSERVQKGFQIKGCWIQEDDHLITWAYW